MHKICRYVVIVTMGVVAISGCRRPNPRSAAAMAVWGNYKCVSVSPLGERFVGWAVFEKKARGNAMTLCQDGMGSSDCHIISCVDEMAEAEALAHANGQETESTTLGEST